MSDLTQNCIDQMRQHVLRLGEAAGQAYYIEASLRGRPELKEVAPELGDLQDLAHSMFRDSLETFEAMVRQCPVGESWSFLGDAE